MSTAPIRLLALGDSAWTVEFGQIIDTHLHAKVMALADQVQRARMQDAVFASVTDVVPTFRSLTVHFSPSTADAQALAEQLLALAQKISPTDIRGHSWRLPACFETNFAPDLLGLAQAKAMAVSDVIDVLLATTFRVYMIGFLPGFPYMGGLPQRLAMPRLATPRAKVPAHSIAVAGEMCAVYPWESPGGWNLIGRTPVPLFDVRDRTQPAMLSAGDTVQWYRITADEYASLYDQCQQGAIERAAFQHQEVQA